MDDFINLDGRVVYVPMTVAHYLSTHDTFPRLLLEPSAFQGHLDIQTIREKKLFTTPLLQTMEDRQQYQVI